MAPPDSMAMIGGGGDGPGATHTGNNDTKQLLASIPRLGATPLPPQTTTPVVGELLLFLPALRIKTQAAPRPPPTRLAVRVAWWGEARAEAAEAESGGGGGGGGGGTLLFPRVWEGTQTAKAAAASAIFGPGGRPLEPRSRENACLFPVRVAEGALWAYLGDVVSALFLGRGLFPWMDGWIERETDPIHLS